MPSQAQQQQFECLHKLYRVELYKESKSTLPEEKDVIFPGTSLAYNISKRETLRPESKVLQGTSYHPPESTSLVGDPYGLRQLCKDYITAINQFQSGDHKSWLGLHKQHFWEFLAKGRKDPINILLKETKEWLSALPAQSASEVEAQCGARLRLFRALQRAREFDDVPFQQLFFKLEKVVHAMQQRMSRALEQAQVSDALNAINVRTRELVRHCVDFLAYALQSAAMPDSITTENYLASTPDTKASAMVYTALHETKVGWLLGQLLQTEEVRQAINHIDQGQSSFAARVVNAPPIPALLSQPPPAADTHQRSLVPSGWSTQLAERVPSSAGSVLQLRSGQPLLLLSGAVHSTAPQWMLWLSVKEGNMSSGVPKLLLSENIVHHFAHLLCLVQLTARFLQHWRHFTPVVTEGGRLMLFATCKVELEGSLMILRMLTTRIRFHLGHMDALTSDVCEQSLIGASDHAQREQLWKSWFPNHQRARDAAADIERVLANLETNMTRITEPLNADLHSHMEAAKAAVTTAHSAYDSLWTVMEDTGLYAAVSVAPHRRPTLTARSAHTSHIQRKTLLSPVRPLVEGQDSLAQALAVSSRPPEARLLQPHGSRPTSSLSTSVYLALTGNCGDDSVSATHFLHCLFEGLAERSSVVASEAGLRAFNSVREDVHIVSAINVATAPELLWSKLRTARSGTAPDVVVHVCDAHLPNLDQGNVQLARALWQSAQKENPGTVFVVVLSRAAHLSVERRKELSEEYHRATHEDCEVLTHADKFPATADVVRSQLGWLLRIAHPEKSWTYAKAITSWDSNREQSSQLLMALET